MLLVIHPSLVQVINDNGHIQSVLELIAQSRKWGNHLVIADTATLRNLSQNEKLSPLAGNIYKTILLRESRSEFKSYLKEIKIMILIVEQDEGLKFECNHTLGVKNGVLEIEPKEEYTVIKASYKYFTYSTFSPTILLTENRIDSEVYQQMTIIYNQHKEIRIPITADIRGGGGHGTKDELTFIQQAIEDIEVENRFCLCITDSDKKSPQSPLGDTPNEVQAIYEGKENKFFGKWLCLEVREIENLFPIAFYQDIFQANRKKQKPLSFLVELQASEARKYISFKKGIKLYDLLKHIETEREYYEHWLELIRDHDSISEPCQTQQRCLKGNSKECTCVIMAGLGTDVLKKIKEKLTNDQAIGRWISQDQIMGSEWEKIRQYVTAWCCASKRIR